MGSSVLADHPLLADVRALPLVELGRSVEGRPILGAVFEAGRGATWLGPARAAPLLVVGGVHGDEPSSVLDGRVGRDGPPPGMRFFPYTVVPCRRSTRSARR